MKRSVIYNIFSKPYIIVPILILGFVLRIIHLDADVPYFIEFHYISDEGGWAHNARNYYIFGTWLTDTHNAPYLSAPGYSYILYCIFNLIGLSLYSGRMVSAVAGSLTVFALWLFLLKRENIIIANIAAFILAFTGFHIIYSRLLMTEILLTFMLMLTLYFWSMKKITIYAVLAGISCSAMFMVKISAAYFLPVFIILFILEAIRNEITLKEVTLFFIGSASAMIIFIAIYFVPRFEEYMGMYNGLSSQISSTMEVSLKYVPELFLFNISAHSLLRGGTFYNKLFMSTPVISMLTVMWLLLICTRIGDSFKESIRKMAYAEIVGLCIIFGNMILIAVSSYKPERRFIPILLGMSILGAHVIYESYRGKKFSLSQQKKMLSKYVTVNAVLALPVIIFVCWTIYVIFGDWRFIDIGRYGGVSLYGQVLLMLPLFTAGIYLLSKTKRTGLEGHIALTSVTLVTAHLFAGWLYYGLIYYGIELPATGIVILTWVIWVVSYVIWQGIQHVESGNKILIYSLFGFILSQGIIIGFILFNPTYTYKNLGETIEIVIKDSPIVTDMSAPFMENTRRHIYYGFPAKGDENDNLETYYVLNVVKREGKDQSSHKLYVFGKVDELPDNAVLTKEYSVLPYGMPEQDGLIVGLWEVRSGHRQ